MNIPNAKKIYFLSDAHLGVPNKEESLKREKHLVSFLNKIKHDALEIYFLGDILDFWFEYRTVVPKGFTRLFGKIAELSDEGISINYFTGNHDMWTFKYFEKELGVRVIRKPITKSFDGKNFLIGHGDGLGPGDKGYKRLKKIFSSRFCQKLFSFLHPGFGTGLALYFSRKSRAANGSTDEIFLGEEKERLIQYCKNTLEKEHYDYFIFGHRHLPLDIKLSESSRYINTGDWVSHFSYAEFDGDKLELKYYKMKEKHRA